MIITSAVKYLSISKIDLFIMLNSCCYCKKKECLICEKMFSQKNKRLFYHTSIIENKLARQERKCHLFPIYVTLPTGDTTTAVPVQKTSSALINSSTHTRRSSTLQEANALVKTALYWRQHMMSWALEPSLHILLSMLTSYRLMC